MPFFFPILALFGLALTACCCGIYLAFRWFRLPNRASNRFSWCRFLLWGWIAVGQGLILLWVAADYASGEAAPLQTMGAFSLFAGPMLWLVAGYKCLIKKST